MAIRKFTEYLAGKGLSEKTMREYLSLYIKFNDGLDHEDLTQDYVNRFILANTSNKTRSVLKHIFDFFEIPNLKISKLSGRKPKKKKRSISPQEIKVMRAWLYNNEKDKFLLAFDLSYLCALRRSEIFSIKIEDFEIQTWAEDPNKPCRLLIHGKGQRERIVPIPPKLMQRVINHIQENDLAMDDLLFNFKYVTWHMVFKKAVEIVGYNYTLHDLRRSRATKWLRDGVDLSRVKNRLGHSSVSTTQLYINLDEEKEFERWADEY